MRTALPLTGTRLAHHRPRRFRQRGRAEHRPVTLDNGVGDRPSSSPATPRASPLCASPRRPTPRRSSPPPESPSARWCSSSPASRPAAGSANGGEIVTINGGGFDEPVRVLFGGTPAEVLSVSPGASRVRTPAFLGDSRDDRPAGQRDRHHQPERSEPGHRHPAQRLHLHQGRWQAARQIFLLRHSCDRTQRGRHAGDDHRFRVRRAGPGPVRSDRAPSLSRRRSSQSPPPRSSCALRQPLVSAKRSRTSRLTFG